MLDAELRISRLGYTAHRAHARISSLVHNLAGRLYGADLSIIGAYHTGNIGDLPMGLTLRRIATDLGIASRLDFIGATRFAQPLKRAVMGGGELGNPEYYGLFRDWLGGNSAHGAVIGVNTAVNIAEASTALLDFLRGLPFISQRTCEAASTLSGLLGRPVHHQPDITFALPALFPEVLSVPSDGRIGLSLCPLYMTIRNQSRLVPSDELAALFARYNPEFHRYLPMIGLHYAQSVSRLADSLLGRGLRLVHIPFSPVDDLFARSILAGRHGIEFVPFRADPLRMLCAVAGCERIYATRFHAHIFGLLAHVPTVSMAYSAKCESLWGELGLDGTQQVTRLDFARDPASTCDRLASMQGATLNRDTIAELTDASLGMARQGLKAAVGAL